VHRPEFAVPTWDFGDGTPVAAGEAVGHTYAQPGTFTITVRAADTLGNATTKTFTVTVAAPAPAPAGGAGATGSTGGGDATAPTVTLALPRCRRDESKRACALRRRTPAAWRTLRCAVRDAGPSSGIAAVRVAVARRGAARPRYRAAAIAGARWSRKLRLLPAGSYVFSVRARDGAGNVSATASRTVRLRASA
jgi:PKD repeat protein